MNRVNIIVWLSAGVVIGWLVSWLLEIEQKRTLRQMAIEEQNPEGI